MEKIKNTTSTQRGSSLTPHGGSPKGQMRSNIPYTPRVRPDKRFSRNAVALDSIASELLLMVFDNLDNVKDMNNFIQTCRRFYLVGKDQLYRYAISNPAVLQRIFRTALPWVQWYWKRPTHWLQRHFKKERYLMNCLLDAGLDVNYSDGAATLLVHAARHSDLMMVGLLLDRGADINAAAMIRDPRHHYIGPALHNAIVGKRWPVAQLLIQYGADLNAVDRDGQTPLSLAVDRSCVEIVEELLRSGASIDTIAPAYLDRYFRGTPLEHAIDRCMIWGAPNLEIVKALLQHGADLSGTRGANMLVTVRYAEQKEGPRHQKTLKRIEKLLLEYGAGL